AAPSSAPSRSDALACAGFPRNEHANRSTPSSAIQCRTIRRQKNPKPFEPRIIGREERDFALVPEVFSKERDQPVQRPEGAVRAATERPQRKEATRPTRAQIRHPSLAARLIAANDEDSLHAATILEAAFDVGFLPGPTGQLCRASNRGSLLGTVTRACLDGNICFSDDHVGTRAESR